MGMEGERPFAARHYCSVLHQIPGIELLASCHHAIQAELECSTNASRRIGTLENTDGFENEDDIFLKVAEVRVFGICHVDGPRSGRRVVR